MSGGSTTHPAYTAGFYAGKKMVEDAIQECDSADAKALADVRTLDDWASEIQSRFWAVKTVNEEPACCLWALDVRELAVCVRVGATPAEARAKAAAWVREQGIESGKGGDRG